ncbi:hypothetical protein NEFER03_1390 [Nematocida sp. LUAm3]|nr:hypothetical protein NEFER03_1390 [Nematocida sp. LUAm3]KAI5174780.1 hypothetical protein NEFER02_0890 [Nematocida sp. LUAm2]KAI5177809.1 hypothetical protein NEFER01_1011 [Nematocida sp. LUAm1]
MSKVVKIHNIDRSITKYIIEQFFSRHGEIKRIILPKRKETDAYVHFSFPSQAKKAISHLDSTTIHDINGRKKKFSKISTEFIWKLSPVEDFLWEEEKDENAHNQLEKSIVKEKKKNMKYVEELGEEILLNPDKKQRVPIISLEIKQKK